MWVVSSEAYFWVAGFLHLSKYVAVICWDKRVRTLWYLLHLSSILLVVGNLCAKRFGVLHLTYYCLIFVKSVFLLSQSHAIAHPLRRFHGNRAAAETIHKLSSFTQLRDVEHPTVSVTVGLYVNARTYVVRTYVGLHCNFKFVFSNIEHPVNSGNLLLRAVPTLLRMALGPSSDCT
jgi:hypothetical protein